MHSRLPPRATRMFRLAPHDAGSTRAEMDEEIRFHLEARTRAAHSPRARARASAGGGEASLRLARGGACTAASLRRASRAAPPHARATGDGRAGRAHRVARTHPRARISRARSVVPRTRHRRQCGDLFGDRRSTPATAPLRDPARLVRIWPVARLRPASSRSCARRAMRTADVAGYAQGRKVSVTGAAGTRALHRVRCHRAISSTYSVCTLCSVSALRHGRQLRRGEAVSCC